MRWKLKIIKYPEHLSERSVRRFLIIPKCLGICRGGLLEYRWLELVIIRQVRIGREYGRWYDSYFESE